MLYFIANWKANLSLNQLINWNKIFFEKITQNQELLLQLANNQIKIILCPPFPFLIPLKNQLPSLPNLDLGAQDISRFETGSYTGEVTAQSLATIVKYVIIGHSERRQYFKETTTILKKKYFMALKYAIEPILCLRNLKDPVFANCRFLAYEPVKAIGTGKNESPLQVVAFKNHLKLSPKTTFIYGGSVDENNLLSYLNTQTINGFLIGKASLDPYQFYEIIKSSLLLT